jgi:hypothetical protein
VKLEYLPGGSPDCPLLRLYDFDATQAEQLRAVFAALAAGSLDSVALHDLPGVEAVGGCRLLLRAGRRDAGIVPTGEPMGFECVLTRATWDNVEGLAEPFTAGPRGYQWLVATAYSMPLLLSSDGLW